MAEAAERKCECCGVSEREALIAGRGTQLVCSDCDDILEREWVAEDPDNRRHYLDTFSPTGW